MEQPFNDLIKAVKDQIALADVLATKLDTIQNIDGVMKLRRKIKQEKDFFVKLLETRKIKVEYLNCSNLRHLGAMTECALKPGVVAVCKLFHISEDHKLVVDVISDKGRTWTKVIARNPKSLSALSAGKASYGARSILDQARDYVECSKLYPCLYNNPKIIFEFANGIEERLAMKLKAIGVRINGGIHPNSTNDDSDILSSSESYDSELSDDGCVCNIKPDISEDVLQSQTDHLEITTRNLDVTTMMAYVSNMTNGSCHFVFLHDVLTQQCAWESERPVKPVLEKLFKDKTLVCCQTAWDEFYKIVQILGGPREKERTEDLRTKLTVMPDDSGGDDDYPKKNLKVRGHVRLRSKCIFNFGHRIKAITVSANEGFVRSAKQQGVSYAAFIHESRALTESKECTAKVLPVTTPKS